MGFAFNVPDITAPETAQPHKGKAEGTESLLLCFAVVMESFH